MLYKKAIGLGALILCIGLLQSCKGKTELTIANQKEGISYQFLTKAEGELANTQDKEDHFFRDINALDMSLQLGKRYEKGTESQIKEKYIQLLQSDVAEFTAEDKTILSEVIDTLDNLLKDVNPKWLPSEIKLVKLNADAYGPGVFYTRENGIYIPKDELAADNIKSLVTVFLHEIYHIMSRYSEEFRLKSYGLIGFKALPEPISIPSPLKERVLLNPDGIDMAYGIELVSSTDEEKIVAVPIIHSNSENYMEGRESFFTYIQFDLFRVVDGEVVIGGEESGVIVPEVPDLNYQSFFEQIEDNTQYIIHPDEIMADNFMFAIFAKAEEEILEQFSPEGRDLLERFTKLVFVEH